MDKIWMTIIAVLTFCLVTFIYWKTTGNYAKKEYGKNMWKQWGTRTFYWSGAFFICGGITVLIIILLRSSKILPF